MFLLIAGGLAILLVIYIIFTLLPSSESTELDTLDSFILESDDILDRSSGPSLDKYSTAYDTEGRQILILYGTEYGFSEEVAKELFDRIEDQSSAEDDRPLQPRVLNAKYYEALDLGREAVVFIVISTAGDGVPPTEAREFCEFVSQPGIKLGHLKYSVLAMGDTNYPHFCKAGKDVDSSFEARGATRLVPRHDVDMEDSGVVQNWLNQVISVLSGLDIPAMLDYLDVPSITVGDGQPDRNNPYMATLKVKYPLTNLDEGRDKETIHLEFDLSGSSISWESGDALGIFPENNTPEVMRFLEAISCTGHENVPVPKSVYNPKPEDGSCILRDVLIKYYDLKNIKPELLIELEQKSKNDDKAEHGKLSHLLRDGISKCNKTLHDYMYEREVVDVLEDFPACTRAMSVTDILNLLRPLQPRYYSISSSPVVDPEVACVTAAVVRYNTLGLERTGVCTTYLQDRLPVNHTTPVFISRNPEFRLPGDRSKPIIMIGPGTGIAPFRAFIQERIAEDGCGQNLLYFGCRHNMGDFLYKEELETLHAEGKIRLRTAFSRDQTQKIYVQNLLLEDTETLWDLLEHQGAHLYICGDARRMARDVHEALLSIAQHSGLGNEAAVEYFGRLEKSNRYQKDVWVT